MIIVTCLCCVPFVVAVATFIGMFIQELDKHVTNRRTAKKKVKAAEKKKRANTQDQQQEQQALIIWRQFFDG